MINVILYAYEATCLVSMCVNKVTVMFVLKLFHRSSRLRCVGVAIKKALQSSSGIWDFGVKDLNE